MERRYIPNAFSPTMRLASNQARVAAALSGVRVGRLGNLGTDPAPVDPLAELEANYQANHQPNPITDWQHVPDPVNPVELYPYSIPVLTVQCAMNAHGQKDSQGRALATDGQWGPNTSFALGRFLGSFFGTLALNWSVSADHRTISFKNSSYPAELRHRCSTGAVPDATLPPPDAPPVHQTPPPITLPPVVESKTDMTTWLLAGAAAVAVGVGAWLFLKKNKKGRKS